MLPVNICRDITYLIFRSIKEEALGLLIATLIAKRQNQQLRIVDTDKTNTSTDSRNAKNKDK